MPTPWDLHSLANCHALPCCPLHPQAKARQTGNCALALAPLSGTIPPHRTAPLVATFRPPVPIAASKEAAAATEGGTDFEYVVQASAWGPPLAPRSWAERDGDGPGVAGCVITRLALRC